MADATGFTPHQHRYSAYSRRGSAGDLQPSSTHSDTIRCHLTSRADWLGSSLMTTYSADGNRQKKVNSSGTVFFVRDGENVLIETDANLVTQAHYTDSPGEWGGLSSARRGSTSSFYGFDQQSNSRILVSIGGNITDSYLYKAFGEELAVSGTTVNPMRYGGLVGYYRDISSRLYVRTRHLQTDLGRWMSRDPIGFDGGDFNLYRYVGSNPVLYFDPNGTGICGIVHDLCVDACYGLYWAKIGTCNYLHIIGVEACYEALGACLVAIAISCGVICVAICGLAVENPICYYICVTACGLLTRPGCFDTFHDCMSWVGSEFRHCEQNASRWLHNCLAECR